MSNVDEIFHPERPVTKPDQLFGRAREVRQVVLRLTTKGGHVLIIGDRGIGKTSVARVAETYLRQKESSRLFGFVSCDSRTNYTYIAKYILDKTKKSFASEIIESPARVAEEVFSLNGFLLIDEVDSLRESEKFLLGELMKQLSDHGSTFTICLSGIARTVHDIFRGHPSVHRCLNVIVIKKLLRPDIIDLVGKGFAELGVEIGRDLINDIASLSKGFPSNAVTICRYVAEIVAEDRCNAVTVSQFRRGLMALTRERGSVAGDFLKYISSQDNYEERYWVLKAAALIEDEEFADSLLFAEAKKLHIVTTRTNFDNICMGFCLDGNEKVFDVPKPGLYRFIDPSMPMMLEIMDYLKRSG